MRPAKDVIFENITLEDVRQASFKACDGHRKQNQVKKFEKNFERNCKTLFERLKDGTYKELIKYRKLVKVNNNHKTRYIDSPKLELRIYQILWLQKIVPLYERKDNGVARNCKEGCGITAERREQSVVKELKRLFYDRRDIHYGVFIDQRQCYMHIRKKVYRKMMKELITDRKMIDFGCEIGFVEDELPIGTPTSPYLHHIIMLCYDIWIKQNTPFAISYADDNFIGCYTKEEAQAIKWRIKNFWWYKFQIRAKRQTTRIINLDKEKLDFCGYVFTRNENKKITEHNKGYVKIRKDTIMRAKRATDRNWGCYYGLLRHADCYGLMLKIEKKMKLRELTQKIRIDRQMDAKHIDMKDVMCKSFTIYKYEIRYDGQKKPNWIKCLIGTPETTESGEMTGKELAYEFHGNYQGLITYILALEQSYGNSFMPMEECEIVNECGYIFKDSTNQLKYIEDGNNKQNDSTLQQG